MDVIVLNGVAQELFPDGAPEFHESVEVIRDYQGEVGLGWDWDGTQFVNNIPPLPTEADNVRLKRDFLLQDTDWWAVADRNMTQEQIDYRQALRDITSQSGFPDNVVWPVKP